MMFSLQYICLIVVTVLIKYFKNVVSMTALYVTYESSAITTRLYNYLDLITCGDHLDWLPEQSEQETSSLRLWCQIEIIMILGNHNFGRLIFLLLGKKLKLELNHVTLILKRLSCTVCVAQVETPVPLTPCLHHVSSPWPIFVVPGFPPYHTWSVDFQLIRPAPSNQLPCFQSTSSCLPLAPRGHRFVISLLGNRARAVLGALHILFQMMKKKMMMKKWRRSGLARRTRCQAPRRSFTQLFWSKGVACRAIQRGFGPIQNHHARIGGHDYSSSYVLDPGS